MLNNLDSGKDEIFIFPVLVQIIEAILKNDLELVFRFVISLETRQNTRNKKSTDYLSFIITFAIAFELSQPYMLSHSSNT